MREAASSDRLWRELDRHWIRATLVAWVAIGAWFLWQRWGPITWLALGDTDDNMRLAQVRAWMAGQDWYDLRQYRLNPPAGFDIHWSRIVDLPIAGLILLLRPLAGPVWAERWAVGIAPLLPLSIAFIGIGATVRRLVAPLAWTLGVVFLVGAAAAFYQFAPTRIDHHGWQLACLAVTMAGLCDPARLRGGTLVAGATALSLSIGLELLPYAAMAGGILALRWVWDRAEARALAVYAATLAGGTAAGFLLFASNDNWAMRCDALTPVWLSVVVGGAALLLVCALVNPASWQARLALGVAAAGLVAAFYALAFPQCLGRLEQVSPELARSWLNNVREAKPVYRHPFRMAFAMLALPVIGLLGAIWATWRARRTERAVGWAAVTLFAAFALALLMWQARAGPAAQLLAVPGAVALAWAILPWLLGHRSMLVRVFGTVGGFLIVSGLFAGLVVKYLPIDPVKPSTQRVNRATARCASLPAMRPLNRLPAQTIFTFTDLGPRLIVLTHHRAVAGPYHRNGDAILDVQHAFSRSPAEAHAIMRRHGATLLLLCPNMAESTIYRARNPGGFYDQMAHGERFDWLTPVALPRGSPLRLYRIR